MENKTIITLGNVWILIPKHHIRRIKVHTKLACISFLQFMIWLKLIKYDMIYMYIVLGTNKYHFRLIKYIIERT